METNKKQQRKRILKERDLIIPDDRIRYSDNIFDKTISLKEYDTCRELLIYASFGSEVITDRIIDHSLLMNKKVYLPRVNGDQMDFFLIRSRDELEEGSWHIMEPKADLSRLFTGNDKAMVFMPLVAFDRKGDRIGYGRGYYDRFLASHETGSRIGLAYSIQECEIVSEDTDIKMDGIITEKEIITV